MSELLPTLHHLSSNMPMTRSMKRCTKLRTISEVPYIVEGITWWTCIVCELCTCICVNCQLFSKVGGECRYRPTFYYYYWYYTCMKYKSTIESNYHTRSDNTLWMKVRGPNYQVTFLRQKEQTQYKYEKWILAVYNVQQFEIPDKEFKRWQMDKQEQIPLKEPKMEIEVMIKLLSQQQHAWHPY